MARLAFSEEVLFALMQARLRKRRQVSDKGQRGLVFNVTPNGGTFFFRYSFGGRQRLLRLGRWGEIDLLTARQRVRELTHRLVDGQDPAAAEAALIKVPTLAEFYHEHYLPHIRTHKVSEVTDASYFRNHLLPAFGSAPMDRITPQDVERFIRLAQDAGLKPSSINRYVGTLKHAFALALDWKIPGIQKNPLQRMRPLKENNQRDRFLTPEETSRLMAALVRSENRELPGIVSLLLLTGARKSEVLKARWEQFDLERRQWRVPRAKSGYHRFIVISDQALKVLQNRQALGIKSPWVFPNPATGKPYVEIFNAWNTARRAAGLADVRIHDLRHSFASALVNGGVPLYEVQKLLGHASIRTTERYAHLAPGRLAASLSVSDADFGGIVDFAQQYLLPFP